MTEIDDDLTRKTKFNRRDRDYVPKVREWCANGCIIRMILRRGGSGTTYRTLYVKPFREEVRLYNSILTQDTNTPAVVWRQLATEAGVTLETTKDPTAHAKPGNRVEQTHKLTNTGGL